MTVSPLFRSLLALGWLSACADGASTGVAIVAKNLTSSECLEDSAAKDSRCVSSKREGKTLALSVFGLQTVCLDNELLDDVPWRAVAREEAPGRVVVSVEWPSDQTPACGSCDYNFKVELGPYDWPDRTDIKFEVRPCPTCGIDDSRSVSLDTKANEEARNGCSDDAGAD